MKCRLEGGRKPVKAADKERAEDRNRPEDADASITLPPLNTAEEES